MTYKIGYCYIYNNKIYRINNIYFIDTELQTKDGTRYIPNEYLCKNFFIKQIKPKLSFD